MHRMQLNVCSLHKICNNNKNAKYARLKHQIGIKVQSIGKRSCLRLSEQYAKYAMKYASAQYEMYAKNFFNEQNIQKCTPHFADIVTALIQLLESHHLAWSVTDGSY